ncbi:hypothetical protein KI387_028500, partial [Taxus chinensis]
TSVSQFTPSDELENTNFVVSIRTKPLIHNVPIIPISAHAKVENNTTTLDPSDNDKVTLEYLNTFAKLDFTHSIVDLSLNPHSSSYFVNPTIEPPLQENLEIYEVE